jgi:hypothetical protein
VDPESIQNTERKNMSTENSENMTTEDSENMETKIEAVVDAVANTLLQTLQASTTVDTPAEVSKAVETLVQIPEVSVAAPTVVDVIIEESKPASEPVAVPQRPQLVLSVNSAMSTPDRRECDLTITINNTTNEVLSLWSLELEMMTDLVDGHAKFDSHVSTKKKSNQYMSTFRRDSVSADAILAGAAVTVMSFPYVVTNSVANGDKIAARVKLFQAGKVIAEAKLDLASLTPSV